MDTVKRAFELSKEHGISIFKLSEACGVPYNTIKSCERRGSQLNVDTIEKLCKGLNIPMSEFFATKEA